MTKRRELTAQEQARAAKARALWLVKKEREGLTQDDANAALGWTTSTFGQYINGRIPMALEATIKIADYLGVDPSELEPSIKPEVAAVRRPQNHAETLQLIKRMKPADIFSALEELARALPPSWRIRLARVCLEGLGGEP